MLIPKLTRCVPYHIAYGLALLTLLTVAAAPVVHAQVISIQAHLAARPLTRGEITAYKLPSTLQVSPGLNTVAVGEPLYLEAQINGAIATKDIGDVLWTLTTKPTGSQATLADSPLTSNVPMFEPSDRGVIQVAGRKLLKPDVPGMYIVSATVAAGPNGMASVAQTFVAGTYVGKAACTVCHSGGLADVKVPAWQKTLHAEIFTDGVNGTLGSYSSGCFGCHTVGYDAANTAATGGFSDMAKQLNWTLPATLAPGNFNAMPDALKNLGNIQCENCHGPGSQHAKSGGNTVEISVATNTGTCSQCHDAPTHHIKTSEWVNSLHAVTTRDPSGAGRESCVGCHTQNGFIGRVKGTNTTAATTDTTYGSINCQTCHEPHGQTVPDTSAHLLRTTADVTLANGEVIKSGGTGKLCMNCHQARQNGPVYAATAAASSRFSAHHGPQTDMLMGTNAYTYGKKIPSSAHGDVVEDTCVTCHMQTVDTTNAAFSHAGGHTFRASVAANGSTPAVDLVGACQTCHGPDVTTFDFPLFDYDGDGVIDGAQTEVQHLMDQLSALLPPAGKSKTALTIDNTWTRAQLEAAYNWQFVHDDGSLGIHNMAYTVGLLKASIRDLSPAK